MRAPVRAQAPHHNPEEPVVPSYAGPPPAAQRDGELLAQEQILQEQRAAAAERPAEDADEEGHRTEHGAMIADHGVCHRAIAPRIEFSLPSRTRG